MPLTLADAFLIPLFAGEIGIPFEGMELMSSLGAQEPPLRDAVAAYQGAYRQTGARVGAQVLDVELRLTRSGLAVPSRPNSREEYLRWSDEVVRQVASLTGPEQPQGVLAAAGRGIGDLLQTIGRATPIVSAVGPLGAHPGVDAVPSSGRSGRSSE